MGGADKALLRRARGQVAADSRSPRQSWRTAVDRLLKRGQGAVVELECVRGGGLEGAVRAHGGVGGATPYYVAGVQVVVVRCWRHRQPECGDGAETVRRRADHIHYHPDLGTWPPLPQFLQSPCFLPSPQRRRSRRVSRRHRTATTSARTRQRCEWRPRRRLHRAFPAPCFLLALAWTRMAS